MKTYEIGEMIAHGQTMKEAKEIAISKAVDALTGSYRPIILHRLDHDAIIWREPIAGWFYLIRFPDGSQGPEIPCRDAKHAECCARYELARITWDGKSESSPLLLQNCGHGEQFAEWAKWNKLYRSLISEDVSKEDAWQQATASVYGDFWANVE